MLACKTQILGNEKALFHFKLRAELIKDGLFIAVTFRRMVEIYCAILTLLSSKKAP
jgi:hypothetical protein